MYIYARKTKAKAYQSHQIQNSEPIMRTPSILHTALVPLPAPAPVLHTNKNSVPCYIGMD